MSERDELAEQFETNRARLKAVAYRMLGSSGEAEDAVQEAWIRLHRSDASNVENLGGWLTTVVSRVCLDMLRKSRREEAVRMPDPIVSSEGGIDPEQEALLADSVGLALFAVLETLTPAERLAFVLHDSFGVPFGEIAPILGRSPDASRQLASRARRRVRGAATVPDADLASQREVVDAFFGAAREGDFDALVSVPDPDVVLRADFGSAGGPTEVRGAERVAAQARAYTRLDLLMRPALVNGVAGAVSTLDGEPYSVGSFTVRGGKIVAIDILADPERLRQLDLTVLGD